MFVVGRGGRAIRSRGCTPGGVQWFEVEPCVVLHTVNAHESPDGSRVVLTALRSTPSGEASFIESYSPAYLHRWVLDRSSGRCSLASCRAAHSPLRC